MTTSTSELLNDYVTGWLDSSVHEFLATGFAPSSNTKFALITCLDSNLQPAEMLANSPELSALKQEAHVIGNALLFPTLSLLRQPRVFYGFDEVWFFPSKDVQPKPSGISLVGPKRVDPVRMQGLEQWMTSQRASMGLGGGDGLNFVVKAPKPARYILVHSQESLSADNIEPTARAMT